MIKWLDGKKTFISAILMVIWSGALTMGYIDQKVYEVGITILGAVGLASMRQAIKKIE